MPGGALFAAAIPLPRLTFDLRFHASLYLMFVPDGNDRPHHR
jgi:hypothetical protein